jgi:signal transduction histidine kinase
MSAAYVPLFLLAAGVHPHVFGFPGGACVAALAFVTMGFLIVRRYPANPVGWIMLAVALLASMLGDADLYALLVYRAGHPSLPLGPVAAWLATTLWGPALSLLPVVMLLFPDGRIASRRWRFALWACVAADAAFVCALGLFALTTIIGAPVRVGLDGQLSAMSAVAVSSTNRFEVVFLALFPFVLASLVVGAAGLIANTRRSHGDRRQQLKWFMYAASFCAGGLAVYEVGQFSVGPSGALTQAGSALIILGLSALPISAAVAVFKYHLYDIDVVIRRTLVYGSLAALITGVYVAIAVGIGTLVGSGGRPNLALSILATALVAVGFQPVRVRLERFANRLVYGERATPYEVLSRFSGQVAETYAAGDLLPRMAQVLCEGTSASTATVWLRAGGQLRPAATSPRAVDELPAIAMNGSDLPHVPGADTIAPVRHHGELLGALTIAKRRGESVTPIEQKLLDDLAHQAGLVLKNVGLTAELLERLEELRASRQRLVTSQDAERRRLERNLHDGAQQHLVALKVKLGLADVLLDKDVDSARSMLQQLKADADEALETLRDLARGIYPPILADRGLRAALESQTRKATIPVSVEAGVLERYTPDVEATVYFCVLEAVQNTQKYARASRAIVRLWVTDGTLRFEVEDDGIGFDPATVRKGAGLTNLADRLDAMGGRLDIDARVGQGCRLSGSLPVPASASGLPDAGGEQRAGLGPDLALCRAVRSAQRRPRRRQPPVARGHERGRREFGHVEADAQDRGFCPRHRQHTVSRRRQVIDFYRRRSELPHRPDYPGEPAADPWKCAEPAAVQRTHVIRHAILLTKHRKKSRKAPGATGDK